MNPMDSDHEILTVREICDLLRQVHQSTIYKLVRQGKIPSFRVGTDWRFRKDLIERWMAEKSMSAGQVRKVHRVGCQWAEFDIGQWRTAADLGPSCYRVEICGALFLPGKTAAPLASRRALGQGRQRPRGDRSRGVCVSDSLTRRGAVK